MDEYLNLNRNIFPAVGRCVYCGSNGGVRGLRDEHIIPFALGGNAVLPKASCADCERITSYLEGYVSRAVFGPMRSFYGIQKRKRKSGHTVTMIFEKESGDEEHRDVNVKDAPPMAVLRQFEPPSILHGLPPRPLVEMEEAWVWQSDELAKTAEALRQPGDKKWTVRQTFKSEIFARSLAKIVHCAAVARFGLDNFTRALPGVILAKEKNIGWLVGGGAAPDKQRKIAPFGTRPVEGGHTMAMYQTVNDQNGHRLLVGDICLFAFTGAPGYRAVIGEPNQKIIDELGSGVHAPEL